MFSASSKTVDTNIKDICEWRSKAWAFEMILFRKSHACIISATDTERMKEFNIALTAQCIYSEVM